MSKHRDTPETQGAVIASNGQWSFILKETCERMERERDEAREQLRIAVGLLSTQPQFADKHPEDVLAFVKEGAK
jgi:hypothetical protein